jgi:hypothetical protein
MRQAIVESLDHLNFGTNLSSGRPTWIVSRTLNHNAAPNCHILCEKDDLLLVLLLAAIVG